MYKLSDSNINAAIAQPVERILGKDEVASSNLASSSKPSEICGFQRVFFLELDNLNSPKIIQRYLESSKIKQILRKLAKTA